MTDANYIGTSQQHETRNKRSTSHDRRYWSKDEHMRWEIPLSAYERALLVIKREESDMMKRCA